MPELPDITVYVEALRRRIVGQTLDGYRILNPFVLRTVDPPLDDAVGQRVRDVERLGKRIVIGFEGELYLVLHLMIAGRLRWFDAGVRKKLPGRIAIQRIRYKDNETNYCPRCQTEGRLLADRALSRLLRQDWPKTIDELEG